MSITAQMSAMKRIEALLDDKSFVEIGALVNARSTDFNMTNMDTPADGVITGYGTIYGSLVYVFSQDSSVLNGSIGEMHAKKIIYLYELALKMGAPIVGMIDCAGLRLQEATDSLNAFGEIYLKQVLASGVVPQINAIFGTSGGGLATMAALTDFTFMEESTAKLFVNSPNAIQGNYTAKMDTSSCDYQATQAGTVDFTGNELDIIQEMRTLIQILPSNNEDEIITECTDDLNRNCSNLQAYKEDSASVLSLISDNNFFMETKKDYARDMVTGFIKLNGSTIGAFGNRAKVFEDGKVTCEFEKKLTPEGCIKAAEFVEFCDAFNIPVLSLTNISGYIATEASEKTMAKATAKLVYAIANASVPKVNVIMEEAFGSSYIAMNSKAIGADVTYAWSNASIGMMDPAKAALIMYEKTPDLIEEKTAEYNTLQTSAISAAKRGYIDSIIEAEDTRKYVVGSFEMLYSKKVSTVSKKHGTV